MSGRCYRKIIIGSLFAVFFLVMLIPIRASANYYGQMAPPFTNVSWSSPKSPTEIQEQGNCFVFKSKINGSVTNLYLAFPSVGGIHIYTDRKGYFQPASLLPIHYSTSKGIVTMRAAGDTIVKYVPGTPWVLQVYNASGKLITSFNANQFSFGYKSGDLTRVKISNSISKGEILYGLGERNNTFNQVGSQILLWNTDSQYHDEAAPTDLTKSYKNIPILHSSKGYMLFFNSVYAGIADIGKTNKSQYYLDFNGPKFDFYIWTGTPLQNIERYTSLTGKPFLPPKWAFEYWAGGGNALWGYSPSVAYGKIQPVIAGYKKLGTSPAAFYGEGLPMQSKGCYDLLSKYGIRMLYWTYPSYGVAADVAKYLPGLTTSQLPLVRKKSNSSVFVASAGNTTSPFVDFTNPNAQQLITKFYQYYWKWGLRGSMLDYQEYMPVDSIFYNGMTGDEMHNFYTYFENKAENEAWNKALNGDFVLFSRAGSAGSQKWSATWAGDQGSTYLGLQETLYGGLNLSTCGFSVWGTDIGGIGGSSGSQDTTDLYMRWMEYGTFSPLMRIHSGSQDRNPWSFGDIAVKMFTENYWMRENLLNDIYSNAIISNKYGVPMMQAMAIAFPDQPGLSTIKNQYIFCNDLLVAPIMTADVYSRSVAFPKGNWYSLWDGTQISGGATYSVYSPHDQLPVYIRNGAVIPVQVAPTLNLMDNMNGGKVNALLVTAPDTSRQSTSWSDPKTSTTYQTQRYSNQAFTITASKPDKSSAVLLYGTVVHQVKVDGKALLRLTSQPTASSGAGYYVDGNRRTIIRLPAGHWKTIWVDPGNKYENLTYHKVTSTTVNTFDENVSDNAVDNNPNTYWSIGSATNNAMTVDLGSEDYVNNIILKWTNDYASNYQLEGSTDNTNWKTILYNKKSLGCQETIRFNPLQIRYIRISKLKSAQNNAAGLCEFEAYGKATVPNTASVQPTVAGGSSPSISSGNASAVSATNGDNSGKSKRTPKYQTVIDTIVTGLPWYIIVLIIAGGVLVLGAGATAAVLLVRRKKQRAAALIAGGSPKV